MDLASWCAPWMDQWHFWTFPRMNLGIHSVKRKRYSKHWREPLIIFQWCIDSVKMLACLQKCVVTDFHIIALVCSTNNLKRVVKMWICGISFCSGKKEFGEHPLAYTSLYIWSNYLAKETRSGCFKTLWNFPFTCIYASFLKLITLGCFSSHCY